MKKALLFGLLLLLGVANVSGKGKNALSVKSGDISVLREPVTATFEVDYSSTKIDGLTVAEYHQTRGEPFSKQWQYVVEPERYNDYFTYYFKKNKGLKVVENATDAPYKIVVHVDKLGIGSGFAAQLFTLPKAGGGIMSGTVDIVDVKTGGIVCTIAVEDLRGTGQAVLSTRILAVFMELGKQMRELK